MYNLLRVNGDLRPDPPNAPWHKLVHHLSHHAASSSLLRTTTVKMMHHCEAHSHTHHTQTSNTQGEKKVKIELQFVHGTQRKKDRIK